MSDRKGYHLKSELVKQCFYSHCSTVSCVGAVSSGVECRLWKVSWAHAQTLSLTRDVIAGQVSQWFYFYNRGIVISNNDNNTSFIGLLWN